MSGEQLIPNAVGRLDDVVEAIRGGRIDEACTLLEAEGDRRQAKLESIKAELEKERDALIDVESFRFELGAATIDRIEKIRLACGGGKEVVIDVPAYETGLPPDELEKLGPGL